MTPLTWVLSGLAAVVLVGALVSLLHRRGPGRPSPVALVATRDPAVADAALAEAAEALDAGTGPFERVADAIDAADDGAGPRRDRS